MPCACAVFHCHLWYGRLHLIFPRYLIKGTILGVKVIEHKMCVLIWSTVFFPKYSHSKNNSARYYHKCTSLFIYSVRQKGKSVPLQAWSDPEGSRKLRFPDFMTTAQDGGKVVSLTHRPPLPPGNAPGIHFCYRLSRPQGHSAIGRILCQWKIPIKPSGIEPTTFRFVAQHLNHCATAVPIKRLVFLSIFIVIVFSPQFVEKYSYLLHGAESFLRS